MDIKTMGEVLRQARQKLDLTQLELANAVAMDRRRLSDIERGRRQPDADERKALAETLDLSRNLLDKLWIEPPRQGKVARRFGRNRPEYVPPRDRPTSRRLLALRAENRLVFDTLWKTLRRRSDWSAVRKFFLHVSSDAKDEVSGWMRLFVGGAAPARLSPQRCGYRKLPVVNPDDRTIIGDCVVPCLVARVGKYWGVIFPQTSVLSDSVYRPDGLVGVWAGRMRWCAIEYDGEGHDSSQDKERPAQLQAKVVRFSAEEVRSPDFFRLFWSRVFEALGIPIQS